MQVYTRDQLPREWANTLNNLGNALSAWGGYTVSEQGTKLLGEAVVAYRNALQVYTRDQHPREWAKTKNKLGIALHAQGIQNVGEQNVKLLGEAVTAYRNALQVYTRDQHPREWANTHSNLGENYYYLKEFINSAKCYEIFLKEYPNDENAYKILCRLYHDHLFEFKKAFFLAQKWLEQNSDSISSLCNFAEKHFTTGRFKQCENRIHKILSNVDANTEAQIALFAIRIANSIALNKQEDVHNQLEDLIEKVSKESDDFKMDYWSFEGVKHFIQNYKGLDLYREWLIQFFNAFASEDRDIIFRDLNSSFENWTRGGI